MHVLIVKTSSLGDIIHTLPALTDAGMQIKDIHFDWVIEEAFAEIPHWHPLVDESIPVALRRWRKKPWQAWHNKEWQNFYQHLRQKKYDYVIDAQGLIKSAFITTFSRGIKCGYDSYSAWEPLGCFAYQQKYRIEPKQHAIVRIRQLFAASLKYSLPYQQPNYGINVKKFNLSEKNGEYCIFLHGTTRDDKCWPEHYWHELIASLNKQIFLPWGNEKEKERAERLAKNSPHAKVLPKMNLSALANLIAHAKAIVSVDTGLGHLAASLNAPTISLYGPTDPQLIGTIGRNQLHLKATSLTEIKPDQVKEKLIAILER